jgi:hypothetical protein
MWFEVDKEGLGKLLERKGKEYVVLELVQNAADENTTRVDVTLERVPGTRSARLTVEDDSPEGFSDLSHVFTLFAESKKKADATKRGRFNLGEKLVLALCDEAELRSTKGGFRFDESGRHAIRAKRAAGSVFTGVMRLTNDEIAACGRAMRRLLMPARLAIRYNGEPIPARVPVTVIEATLPTEIADAEGRLRRTTRKTTVEFHEPLPDEDPTLYEMGIPVVATGDRFHVNVQQKIPLTLDRDNVTPAYLAQVRALAVEHLVERLTSEDANATWVRDAVEHHGDDLPGETVGHLITLRFGERRVAYDPSDPEANSRAVAAGHVVVHGGQMSRAEWDAAKRAGAIAPAGKLFPTYRPYSADGDPAKFIPEARWTPGMKAVADAATLLARKLLGKPILVRYESGRFTDPWSANYGGAVLTFNYERMGKRRFDEGLGVSLLDLLIHEFGHDSADNHLSDGFADALTRLGAKLAYLAANDEEVRALLKGPAPVAPSVTVASGA